ncbi:MAG: DUF1269 domain-containing protein [Burkholderiaceae bacterium]|nr:DUF1269 domain-containing protein [Burkholderiaceae bacterium]
MRRRLYFMLPDLPAARVLRDALLLARVNVRQMHFFAKEAMPADMPEANFLQKTDLVHGMETGIVIGGGAGLLGGILLVMFPPEGLQLQMIAILVTGIGGALFGAWASGMAAAAIPNSRLKSFEAGIESGQVLLMLDIPMTRVTEIEELLAQHHPNAKFGGVEPHIPAFP